MIYRLPPVEDPVDQGDIIEEYPAIIPPAFDVNDIHVAEIETVSSRVIVLTQTCDLATQKVNAVLCAVVFEAQGLIDQKLIKAADVRGPIRAGRVFGWYYLPKSVELNLPEMIVDFRQLHTVRLEMLTGLCRLGKRRARVQPLYREHLARHFGDTYSRIGLPEPYATD